MNSQQAKNTAVAIADKLDEINVLLKEIGQMNVEYSTWIYSLDSKDSNPIIRELLEKISSDEFRVISFLRNSDEILLEFKTLYDFFDYAAEEMQYL